jgi:hypothetical protein
MGGVNPLKLFVILMMAASIMSLAIVLPGLNSQREVIRQETELLVAKAKLLGEIDSELYLAYIERLKSRGIIDQIEKVIINPVVNSKIQKRSKFYVEVDYFFIFNVPYLGVKNFDAPNFKAVGYSQRYWKDF